ncbi:MAG: hypothetical protein R3236_06895 [Phycisphaeraceae bacterium]|nr:hypothetical protein [Phycisphaeraceae bacterium]
MLAQHGQYRVRREPVPVTARQIALDSIGIHRNESVGVRFLETSYGLWVALTYRTERKGYRVLGLDNRPVKSIPVEDQYEFGASVAANFANDVGAWEQLHA